MRNSLILLMAAGPAISSATTWNLAGDWSDAVNPFGAWTLMQAPGVPFTTHYSNWFSTQPGWAIEPHPYNGHVPVWLKEVEENSAGLYAYPGQVSVHSAESGRTGTEFSSVRWTSPIQGTIYIRGGIWFSHGNLNRPQTWRFSHNGTAFTEGEDYYNDGYSADNPRSFDLGTGSSGAMVRNVQVGDTIDLTVFRTSTSTPGAFSGMNYSISTLTAMQSLSGHVDLQQLNVSSSGQPIVIEIRRSDGTLAIERQTATLDANGDYSAPIPLEGSYLVRAKGTHWLSQSQSPITIGASGGTASFSLVNGDVDGSNVIDLGDFDALAVAFGSELGDGNFNPNADLDGSQVVDLGDFDILALGFGQEGS